MSENTAAGEGLDRQTGGDGTQAQDIGVGLTGADDGNAVNGAQDTPPAGEPQPSDKGDADIPGLTTAGDAKAGDGGEGDDKKGDGNDDVGGAEPKPYELHVPDGFALDTEMLDAATPLLQKYGVTNEDAQALADLVTQKVQKELDGFHERNGEMVEEWKKKLVSDPEIGGKNLKQNLGVGLRQEPETESRRRPQGAEQVRRRRSGADTSGQRPRISSRCREVLP